MIKKSVRLARAMNRLRYLAHRDTIQMLNG
jgi:hypothetical protein